MDKKELGLRIKKFRSANNLTQQDIADYLNLKNKSTVGSWEIGKSEPDIDTFAKLCILFNISPNEFINFKENVIITLNEKKHIEKYRILDDYGKESVDSILNIEYRRTINTQTKDSLSDVYNTNILKIPLADASLSAGTGNLLLTNSYELIEVDGNKYPNADVAFKIKGDSMEPKYFNGDIVYIHKQPNINIGEIGAFLYDNEQYIKQLINVDGVYKLHSLNAKNENYKDIEIKSELITYGKVIN